MKTQAQEETWLCLMTEVLIPKENSKKQIGNTKRHQKLRLYKDCGPNEDSQLE